MKLNFIMTERKATFILILTTLFWGASFLFMKLGLDSFAPFNIMSLRFGIAFILLIPIVIINIKDISLSLVIHSFTLGIILFSVFSCILFALRITTTSNAGFLQALPIFFVPVFEAFISKRYPEQRIIIGCIIAIVGLAFLSVRQSFLINFGDILCIISSVIYAIYIIYTDRIVKGRNCLLLGVLQFGVVSLLGFIFSLSFENFALPYTKFDWIVILILAIFCSAFGFIGQIFAQKFINSVKTGMILSLEPLFAAIFGYVFLDERLSLLGYLGGFLMLVGITIANTKKQAAQGKLNERKTITFKT